MHDTKGTMCAISNMHQMHYKYGYVNNTIKETFKNNLFAWNVNHTEAVRITIP